MTPHIWQLPRAQADSGCPCHPATSPLARRWPRLLAEGSIGVAVGLLALFSPALTLIACALLLGVGLMLQGVIGVLVSLRSGVSAGTWHKTWTVAFAVLSIVAGLICVIRPGAGVAALVFGLVLWFVVVSVNDLTLAGAEARHRGWNLALGALSLIIAAGLISNPTAAISTLALLAGLGFILRGGLAIGLSVVLRETIRRHARTV